VSNRLESNFQEGYLEIYVVLDVVVKDDFFVLAGDYDLTHLR